MLNDYRQSVLNTLLKMQANGPKRPKTGICQNIEDMGNRGYDREILTPLFKNWPLYSGDETFPVPGANGQTADSAYLDNNGNIWDKRTTYGRNRWLLLEHLIVQLQIQLSKP